FIDLKISECLHHCKEIDIIIFIRKYENAGAHITQRHNFFLSGGSGKNQLPSITEDSRLHRNFQPAVHYHSQRLPECFHVTHGKLRVICQHGANTGQNCAGAGTKAVAVAPRRIAGDPLASTIVERSFSVETCRDFHPYPWTPACHARDKTDVE